MDANRPTEFQSLPYEIEARIDDICGRFEKAWQNGPPPHLEDYLPDWPAQQRHALLKELAKLELAYRGRNGEAPSRSDFVNRFPGAAAVLEDLFAEEMHSLGGSATETASGEPRTISSTLPRRIGRYVIEAEIGRGGMGVVYLGHDPDLDRPLAVKVIREQAARNVELQRRFLAEARVMGGLQHPGIAPIHEVGTLDDGRPFFAMKQVKGKTLAALLKERYSSTGNAALSQKADNVAASLRESLPRFIAIFDHVCQALAYAHSQGIIHRDLKPANIMVGAFGEVQVMDWGLAKRIAASQTASEYHEEIRKQNEVGNKADDLDDAGSQPTSADIGKGPSLLTATGAVMGTPAYMAPEQARGEVGDLDARADVFGLGAILCEILTGHPPFRGSDARELLEKASAGNLTDVLQRLLNCPADAELIDLAKRCLAQNKRYRLSDAGVVADSIAAYQAGIQEKLRQTELQRAQAEVKVIEERRRRGLWIWLLTAAAALLISVTAGLVVISWKWGEAEENLDLANKNYELAKNNETRAKKGEKLAKQNELKARKRAYVLSMKTAYQAFEEKSIRRVHAVLDSLIPEWGQVDLREFEWHLLKRLCRQEDRRLDGHDGIVMSLAWSPKGNVIATGSYDKHNLRLWDAKTGKLKAKYTLGHFVGGEGNANMVFTSDGSKLALIAGNWRKKQEGPQDVKMLDLATGKFRDFYSFQPDQDNSPTCVAISNDGRHLAAGFFKGEIYVWDVRSNEPPVVLVRPGGRNVVNLCFTPGNKTLIASNSHGDVVFWDLPGRRIQHEIKSAFKTASTHYRMALSPNGRLLAFRAAGGIVLYDLPTRKEAGRLENTLPGSWATQNLAFSPDGTQLAIANSSSNTSCSVELWHVASRELIATFAAHETAVYCVAFSPDGNFLASGGHGPIRIWDISPYRDRYRADQGYFFSAQSVSFAPDSRRLAIGANNILLMQYRNAGLVHLWPHRFNENVNVAWSNKGDILATVEGRRYKTRQYSRDVVLWDAKSEKRIRKLQGLKTGSIALAFSPDDKYVAAGPARINPVLIWETATGKLLHSLKHERYTCSVCFSPDGKTIAVGTGTPWFNVKGELKLWDMATGKFRRSLHGQRGSVNDLAYSKDGDLLAAGTSASQVLVWNPTSGKLLHTLEGNISIVTAIAFSPNGKRLASGDNLGLVKLWDPKTGDELASLKVSEGVYDLDFSADGRMLAVAVRSPYSNQRVRLLSVEKLPERQAEQSYKLVEDGSDLRRERRFSAAIEALQHSLKIDPRQPQAWHELGLVHLDRSNPASAEKAFERAVALDPEYVVGWNNLGHVRRLQKKFADSEKAFQKVRILDPANSYAVRSLGLGRMQTQDYARAEVFLRHANRLDPAYTLTYLWLGRVLLNQGKFTAAISFLKQGIERRKYWIEAHRELQKCEKLLALSKRLPQIIKGTQTTARERAQAAELCFLYSIRPAAATELYKAAFSDDPKLADDLKTQYRYHAASAAVLTSYGKDVDLRGRRPPKEKQRVLRDSALKWLKAELAARRAQLQAAKPAVLLDLHENVLPQWLTDAKLAGVRDKKHSWALQPDERKAWQQFWSDLEMFRRNVAGKFTATTLKGNLTQDTREQVHRLTMNAGKIYIIDMESDELDPYLRLQNSEGKSVAKDDDGGKELNARMIFTPAESGAYQLIATSFEQRGWGAYRVTIREIDTHK